MANGKIIYDIGFNVDKSGLNELKSQLESMKKLTATDLMNINPNIKNMSQAKSEMLKLRTSIHDVEIAFQKAFDPTIGVTNINTLYQNLNKLDLNKITTSFKSLGSQGEKAFSQIATKAMTTNLKFKETNNTLDKLGKTLMNTLRWTISSSVIKKITGTLSEAVGYIEHLDSSLNDIRIVTKKSADEMDVFAQKANDAAKSLGKATTDYTEAALIYYQQGLSDEEVKARAETTLKAANVTGQATKTVSEQLTSVWNGFRVNAEQTEEYIDKLAAVAAISASNLEELSTGMSKVASAANNLGVDVDQLTAQISTIVSVTRQAPESVGTALKTIYARISDLKLGETDEDGLKLGDVSGGLQKLGINVLDAEGELRDLGTVIEEVAEKWDTWTSAQQAAIAQLMAGKRQYNNLVALFSNWDMYEKAIDTSRNATGELQKQQDIYMESTEAHLQQLKTQWEDLYDSLLDNDTITDFADGLTNIVKMFTTFIDSIGGGKGLILGFGAVLSKVFNKQISSGLEQIITKFKNIKDNNAQLQADLANTRLFAQQLGLNPKAVDNIIKLKEQVQQYYNVMSQEEIQEKNNLIEKAAQVEILKQDWEAAAKAKEDYVKKLAESQYNNGKNKSINKDTYTNVQGINIASGQGIEESNKSIQISMQSAQKMSKTYDKVKQAYQEYVNALKTGDVSKAYKNLAKAQDEWDKAEQKFIQDAALDQETQDKLNNSYNKLTSSLVKLVNAYNGVDKATTRGGRTNAFNKALEQENQLVEEVIKNVIELGQNFNKETSDLHINLENATADAEKFKTAITSLKEFDLRQTISQVTSFVGNLSTIGFSLQSLTSIIKTLEDETLSSGEKIIQVMISVGMVIPGILKMTEGLIAARTFLTTITQAQLITEGEKIAVDGVAVGIIDAKTLALQLAKAEEEKYIGVLGESTFATEIKTGAITEETTAIVINTAAKEGNAQATTFLNNGIKMSSGLLGKIATKFSELTSKIGLTGSALGAIGIGIAASVGMNKAIQAQIEHMAELATKSADAAKKETDAAEQKVQETKKLEESLNDLSKQYDENSITIDQFREKVYDMAIQYGDEKAAVDALTASYEELNNIINNLQGTSEKEYLESIAREKEALSGKLENTIYRDLGETEQDQVYYHGQYRNTLDLEGFYGDNINTNNKFIQGLQNLGIKYYGDGQLDMESLANVIVNDYDKLQELLDSSSEKGAIHLQKILDGHKEDIERIQALNKGEEAANKKLRIRELKTQSKDVDNQDEATKVYDEYIEKATNAGKSLHEAELEFSQQAEELDNKYLQDIAQRNNDIAAFRDIVTDGLNFTSGTKVTEKVKQKLDELNQAGVNSSDFKLLTDDQWKDFYTGKLSAEEIAGLISEKRDAALKTSRAEFEDKGIFDFNTNFNKDLSGIFSGDIKAGTEEFEQFEGRLKELKELFPELATEVDILMNDGLVGTEKWTQAAFDLQDQLDKMEFIALDKKFKDELNDLSNGTELKDLKKELDEVLNADYEINVKVHSDAERDFDQMNNALNDLDTLAGKIGEDFIVAADDIRALNNAFPGIIQDMEYLADGTVKLNEEVVKSAMAMADEEAKASTEATMKKLQNSAQELRAKAEIYDAMAQEAYKAAENETYAETAKSNIIKDLTDLEASNDEAATNAEIDNANLVVDNSAENAPVLAANWDKAYQTAARAANDWAQVATAANKAVTEGDTSFTPPKTNFGANFEGQTHTSSERATKAQLESKNAKDIDFRSLGDNFTSTAEALRKDANDIEGMAAQLGAKGIGAINKSSHAGNKTEDSSKSGSEKEADHMDYLEREENIYREINTELENIESTLGRIDEVASHSWGEDYQQTLKEQNKLLDQQINKLEEKRDLQKGDLSTRRKQLEDVGVTFAEDGSVMTNAEQVLNELYAGYNAMVTKYNAMSASEQEAYKAQMETEKNRIDAIEKKIGEYESTYSEFQSTLDELLEKHYADIENEVNQFNNKINVELELSDARKEWNDFWKDVVADVSETDFGGQIAASLKQLKELIGLGSGGQGIVGKLTTHLSKITSEVWAQINSANNGGQDSMFGDDTKLSKETLQEFISKTMSAIQDAEKEVDNIAENYLKTLESAKDIIDAQVDGYETISKHIDHNVNMIKLLDPEDYEALDRQYQRQYENDLNLVKTQRASKEFWQEQMKVHQQMRDSYEKGSKQWETYNKAYKEAVDNYVDATEAFDKAMEDALDKAKEIADNAAEAAYKRLDRSLSSNLSLEVMEDEWKLLNDEADRYYDNVERYLNMEEYTNYLNDAANAIGLSAENQEKLNAFRDTELKKLKEKEKLTEYDIEESKARLEIMKAEMALEDAQRNKSNMRLRRDSQGNYTYQYTADEEAIEDAENGIVTAKKAWYEIVKKRWKDVSQYIIDISKNIVEYQKKYREAKDRGDEEAAAKYLQLIEHQQKDLQLMYSEAAKNQQDLFSGTAQYFANVENAEILPQSKATVRTMVSQWTEGDDSFMGAIQDGIDEINRIQQQYVDDTQKVFKKAGESYEGLRDNGIDPTKDSLDALVESQGDLDDNLKQITEDLRDHSEALDDAVRGYEDLKGAAVDAITEANRVLETLAATAIDAKTKVNEAVTASQTAPGIGYNSVAPSSSSNSGNSGNNTSLSTGPALNSNTGKYTVNASDRNGFQLNGYPIFVNDKGSAKVEARRILSKRQNYTVTINGPEGLLSLRGNTPAESDRYISAEEERKLKAYKTGGYTGSWGDTGKLAVLHEKELVLNSSDTKNLLSAIEILRALPFSALAKSIVDSSSNIASIFRSGVSMNGVNGAVTNNDTKNMTINADFSGVQSADEIYQALIELENYGLQQSYSVAPNINNPY